MPAAAGPLYVRVVTATQALPQLGDAVFLTDGGVETDLIFHRGIELPDFASFVLHDDPAGEAVARDYFRDYLNLAAADGFGLVLETLTWRASPDWVRPSATTTRGCVLSTSGRSRSCASCAIPRPARPSS